jgi:hypothetical protein
LEGEDGAFKPSLMNPASDPVRASSSGTLLRPRRDRKCPEEVGVEVIGSWRLQ